MNCSLRNGTTSGAKTRLLNSMGHILNHSLKTTKPWRSRGLPQAQVVREMAANALRGVGGAAEYGGTSAGVNKLRCPFSWVRERESSRTRASQREKWREVFFFPRAPTAFLNLRQDTQGHFNSHAAAKHHGGLADCLNIERMSTIWGWFNSERPRLLLALKSVLSDPIISGQPRPLVETHPRCVEDVIKIGSLNIRKWS